MIRPKDEKIKVKGFFNENYVGIPNAIYAYHEGIDFPVPIGTPIITDRESIVISAIKGITGYGNCIVLQDIEDKRLFYIAAHLSEMFVVKNQVVKNGSIIGKSGNTGGKTGKIAAHLHSGTYIVESEDIWNDTNTGFYYSEKYYVNQKYAVNPLNLSEKWKGA
ncbi:MAG: M23 family metallopeptidase [Lutibacter sp.]|jgi:murein DD-endopeptidase MepM/ murein hydrolase activator NlpD